MSGKIQKEANSIDPDEMGLKVERVKDKCCKICRRPIYGLICLSGHVDLSYC